MKELRDLVLADRADDPRESLQRVVARWRAGQDNDRTLIPERHAEWTARLPGNSPEHPLLNKSANPYPGVSPQALMRALRNNTLPQNKRQAVFHYLDQFRKLEYSEGHGRPAASPEASRKPGADSFWARMQT